MTSSLDSTALLLKAAKFAADKHRDQRRKGENSSPYINHPIDVAEMLSRVGGIHDPLILAAALLHDTVEDTETTADELEREFGTVVRDLVEEVTDDKSLDKQVRKRLQIEHAAHLTHGAKLIKLADKIANVTDVGFAPPHDWDGKRRSQYLEWAKKVVEQLGNCNGALNACFDDTIATAEKQLGI
jgi:guanosine-3',5'-bis(diphosphate) 3'-pyrophosphohydrolase